MDLGSPAFLRTVTVAAYAMVSLLLLLGICEAAPVPLLQDQVARLPFGEKKGTVVLKLKIDGLEVAQMSDKTLLGDVTDTGQPAGPTKVKRAVSKTELFPMGVSARYWDLAIDVDELPPNSPETRILRMIVAGRDYNLVYTLTNQAKPSFMWTIKPYSATAIHPPEAIQISIAVGMVPATNVTVLQSALIEKMTKLAISKSGLHLCEDGHTDCKSNKVDLPANSSNQLWLWGVDRLGQFDGTVTIGAQENPQGETVPLSVYVSSDFMKAWGVTVIFSSVLLTWLSTSFLRNRADRDRMLLPVSSLLTTLSELNYAMSLAPTGMQIATLIGNQIKVITSDLSNNNLSQHGLLSKIPLLGTPDSTSLDSYRLYVQSRIDWTQVLQILIHEGLEHIWSMSQDGTEEEKKWMNNAITAIDRLAYVHTAPDSDAIRSTVRNIVDATPARIESSLANTAVARAASSFAKPDPVDIESPEQLLVSIDRTRIVSWVFLLGATTLSGAYIFIFGPSGAGFGTAADFVLCGLWGFGIPTGAQLMQSTTGTISANFK